MATCYIIDTSHEMAITERSLSKVRVDEILSAEKI